jgi:hypothetical protein
MALSVKVRIPALNRVKVFRFDQKATPTTAVEQIKADVDLVEVCVGRRQSLFSSFFFIFFSLGR